MGTAYEDPLFDFDLGFLTQNTTNTVQTLQAKNEKLRRSVIFLKKKILFSHSSVTRYKTARNYANILENNQVFNKEGCKQHLIEIRNFIEKVARLENECRAAENREREKNELICELQNKLGAQESLENQLKQLLKEKNRIEATAKAEKKKGHVRDCGKKGLVDKDNEALRKENARIPILEKEIENLRKENTRIAIPVKGNDSHYKEITKIQNLEKEIETLRKENTKILRLEKEIETLRKENVKIPKLEKEIQNLRKENAKVSKLGKENETLRKENSKIAILEKQIESLHIKNAKTVNLERVHKALRKENTNIQNNEKEIGPLLTHLTSGIKENAKSPQKYNQHTRKRSLHNRNCDWSDNSDTDLCEDAVLSPTPNNTVIAKMTPIADKDNIVSRESDNDNSNEVVSVDTGRGSSLAYSDYEKGVHSPDYFLNDSPSNGEKIENKAKSKDVSMPRSPNLFEERVVPASIPIIVHNENQDICEFENISFTKRHSKLSSSVEISVNQVNVAREVSTNPKKLTQCVHEKEFLELNSLRCENHLDSELEKIFSTMKLNYKCLSPIPPTREHDVVSTTGPCEPSEKILRCMFLSDKSDQLLVKLKGFIYRYTEEYFCKSNPKLMLQSESKFSDSQLDCGRNNVDKLITCFETIIRTIEILNEDFRINANSSLEKSDRVLSQDDNNLLITNRLSTESVSDILKDKQALNRLIRTPSPILLNEDPKQLLHDDNNLVSLSISSPPERDPDILQDKHGDHRSPIFFPMSLDKNEKQLRSVSEELMTDKISKATDSVRCPHNSPEINQSAINNSAVKKGKNKKETKLEKLKKNLKPKYKIKRETPLLVKSRNKAKQVSPIQKKDKMIHPTENDTCASLNDKHVYEKAVKIMAEINLQQNSKIPKSPPKCTKSPMSPKPPVFQKSPVSPKPPVSPKSPASPNSPASLKSPVSSKLTTCLEKDIDSSGDSRVSQNCSIITRSKRKLDNCTVVLIKDPLLFSAGENKYLATDRAKENKDTTDEPLKKRPRRLSNEPEIQCKRILRSSTVNLRLSTEDNHVLSNSCGESNRKSIEDPTPNEVKASSTQLSVPNKPKHVTTVHRQPLDQQDSNVVSYGDMDVFSEDKQCEKEVSVPVKEVNIDPSSYHPKESILCCMIEKYGVENVRPFAKKLPDLPAKQICEKIEQEIATISDLPLNDTKNGMNRLVADLRKLNYKNFISGLIKYLTKPERKHELFGKVSSSTAPAMTKAEQILLYVITHLKTHWPSVDIVDAVLSNIEYTLFKLNRTPEFDVIESTSHFYALLCRYFGAKSRLRLFILDAMYCIQFKSVPLIKQCLEVWMHIIPLAHMGIAKSPLVTCLVYLLNFYKCDDKFNRVQEIRNILSRRYFYKFSDWNETKILEMIKNSIKDLKDIPIEKKMLRLALIILAKRHGPRWCHNNIIKNLLLPMIEKVVVPNTVKEFCVSMIGPLMKPYPVDMKVHCEIAINQLTDILNNNPSPKMEEAAIMSMMFMNRHNQHSINQMLLSRKMIPMSPELEKIIRDYVKARPLKIWKKTLTKIR